MQELLPKSVINFHYHCPSSSVWITEPRRAKFPSIATNLVSVGVSNKDTCRSNTTDTGKEAVAPGDDTEQITVVSVTNALVAGEAFTATCAGLTPGTPVSEKSLSWIELVPCGTKVLTPNSSMPELAAEPPVLDMAQASIL